MDCPKCGLINPDSAKRCDCGYDFEEQAMDEAYVAEAEGSRVREVGLAHRLLMWAILASIVGWVNYYVLLVAIPFQLYCAHRLAGALGLSADRRILYTIAMFVPVVSLICLVVLNTKSVDLLRRQGVPVGLMGPRRSDLPRRDGSE